MTEKQVRRAIVDCFYLWVGYSEAEGNYKTIIDVYNKITPLPNNYKLKYTDGWCAATVSAVAWKAGLTKYVFPECSCNRMIALYQKNNRWEEKDDYKPQIGDLCFYDWDDDGVGDCTGEADHVGMVCEVSGNTFKVIEGNRSKQVKVCQMQVNGKFIRGFGLPDYAKAAVGYKPQPTTYKLRTIAGTVPYLFIGCSHEAVKMAKVLFNALGFNAGTDEVFDERLETVVKQYQKMYNLRENGVISRDVWAILLQGKPKK